jgi:nucleotide-binding universal stress UspA family protein
MGDAAFVVVVGLDYSELSDLALERAFELASREPKAEVHVVNVLSPLELAPPNAPKGELLEVEIAATQLLRHVSARLNAYAESHATHLTPCQLKVVSHVRFDQPANAIVQLASDLAADLIVMGTHGRQGLTRFLLGSVSERVLRLAPCAVLVTRPKVVVVDDPVIEPPCARCQAARAAEEAELWCEQHQAKHARRHTHHLHDGSAAPPTFSTAKRS